MTQPPVPAWRKLWQWVGRLWSGLGSAAGSASDAQIRLRIRAHQAMQTSGVATWELDVPSGRVLLSAQWAEMLGEPAHETITSSQALLAVMHPEDRERSMAASLAAMRGLSKKFTLEHPFPTVTGKPLWIRSVGEVTERDALGRATRLIGTNIDITELRTSQARVQAVLEASVDPIVILDAHGMVTALNPAAQQCFGVSRQQALGRPLAALVHDQVPEQGQLRGVAAVLGIAQLQTLGERIEVPLRQANGSERLLEMLVAHHVGPSDEEYIAYMRDVTNDRRVEAELREAQKHQAIGQLTGGLAHDFNNLLGIVSGNLDNMEAYIRQGSAQTQRQYHAALEASLRATQVAHALLAVARRQPMAVRRHDLNQLIADMLPLLRSSINAATALHTELSAQTLWCQVDASSLANALLNLVINARDAMHGQTRSAHISIRSGVIDLQETRHELAPAQYAVITVADTGAGMDAAIQSRAFEPFFTTKAPDMGTGLGLPMVRGFAQQLGGTAIIEHSDASGTAVQLLLPLQAATPATLLPAAPASATSSEPPPQWPSLRVLMVEDEPELCELAMDWLRALGHHCTAVHTSQAALETLETQHFDLLFTDVLMPGPMDGLALVQAVAKRHPGMRILITSGYMGGHQIDVMPGPFLSKPYRRRDLYQALQALQFDHTDTQESPCTSP